MLKNLFSKKKSSSQLPLVDIHSHLLPGIDDGAPTMEHSLAMIQRFVDLGYKKLITTPHIKQGVFNNTKELILAKCNEVKQALIEATIEIDLECSAEYFFDDHFLELIRKDELLPFHGNHILFECSFHNPPNQLEELVFTLKRKGFRPILAHFERYSYFHGSVDLARDLRERGCMIQVNWNSFSDHYGPDVRKQAQLLLKENLIDIYGSDCHRIEHLRLFERLQSDKYVQKLLNSNLQNDTFLH